MLGDPRLRAGEINFTCILERTELNRDLSNESNESAEPKRSESKDVEKGCKDFLLFTRKKFPNNCKVKLQKL